MESYMTRIEILGVPVDVVTDENLPAAIEACYKVKSHRQIVLLEFHDILRARRSKSRMKIIREAALVLPVSSLITGSARFLKKKVPPVRRPYPFVIRLLTILEERRQSVYLLGLDMVNVRNAEASIRATFPGLSIVGRYTARFNKERESDVITAIKKASPSLLLASRGLKGKMFWINRNRKKLSPGLSLWEQSCFDVFAGRKPKPNYSFGVRASRAFFSTIFMPWRLLRVFSYLFFYFLLVIERIGSQKT